VTGESPGGPTSYISSFKSVTSFLTINYILIAFRISVISKPLYVALPKPPLGFSFSEGLVDDRRALEFDVKVIAGKWVEVIKELT